MSAKQIIKGKEVRSKLLSGVAQIAEIVSKTLGPKGTNVGIQKKFINNVVINDGVSIAREIDLPDPFEDFGAQLVKEASIKSNDRCGDGTSTSMLLAWKIIEEGFKKIDAGANPMPIKKGIETATRLVIEELKKHSQKIKTKEQITQVATVSCADEGLGKIIGEAFDRVGKDGVITVEENASIETKVEYKEGMEFDKGYISPYFATNIDKMETEIESPHILIADHVISSAQDIATFLDRFVKETNRAEIVIIAPSVEGAALSTLVINKERGNIKPVAIFAPAFASRRISILEDIAVLTGATLILKDKDMKIENVSKDQLGYADKVWCDGERTKIIGGFGKPENIEARVRQIKNEIEKTDSEFEKEKLRERIARLTSGAAIIRIGAMTEVELKDKKERAIDAVEATKSALEEGIVAGGGLTLLAISDVLSGLKERNDEETFGVEIVYKALSKPAQMILKNAGADDEVLGLLRPSENFGYDVENNKFGNLFKLGIIDPTKVVKNAISNAASVAALLLTTEAVIVSLPDNEKTSYSEYKNAS